MLGRCVYVVALILALAGVYACWLGTALTWDGAYQFGLTLVEQRPYAYGTRLHSWLLWHPVVWLSHWTQNLTVLQFAYGLPFALAPAGGLLASWWVVRRERPELIVWALFGIAIAPLPGQIFVINDSIFQQHLFWPVFLGLFVPLTRAKRATLGVLALFQLAHPIGLLLLAIGAAAAGWVAWRVPEARRAYATRAVLLAGLAAVALGKILGFPDAQAADEFRVLVAQNRWRKGVSGAPLIGLSLFWLAGLLVFARAAVDGNAAEAGRRGRRIVRMLGWAVAACVAVGAAVWLAWATDERRWAYALDYRRWLVPLSAPFFALCAWEAGRRRHTGPASAAADLAGDAQAGGTWNRGPAAATAAAVPSAFRLRARVGYALAATFAAVLCCQSAVWGMLSRRLLVEVQSHPAAAVPRAALPWIDRTPLEHWGLAMYLAALQGPAPRKVFLYDPADAAPLRADPPRVPLDPWEPKDPAPGPGGWFDHRPLVKNLTEGER